MDTTHLSESSTAQAWHTTWPHPPDSSNRHEVLSSSSSSSVLRDEAAEIDVLVRRLTFERVLMDIASRAPRSSTSISSTLLEGCSAESWFNMVLGDGVAEKQSNGVGGVEIAASVHVRAQTEQVGIKHLHFS